VGLKDRAKTDSEWARRTRRQVKVLTSQSRTVQSKEALEGGERNRGDEYMGREDRTVD
jgi:hypothetical protein